METNEPAQCFKGFRNYSRKNRKVEGNHVKEGKTHEVGEDNTGKIHTSQFGTQTLLLLIDKSDGRGKYSFTSQSS